MRQMAAALIFIALFVLLVGTRFEPSDGDRLASVGRLAVKKVRVALPPPEKLAGPFQLLRREIPERIEDKVRARLESDSRFQGLKFEVTANGSEVTIRGVMPDAKTRRIALGIAEHTAGVEKVVDELAVPDRE